MKHLTIPFVVVLISLTGCSDAPQDGEPSPAPQPNVGCATDSACDDGTYCNGAETCNRNTGDCEQGSTPCSSSEFCNEQTDRCVACLAHTDCDDGDPCADDFCDGGECISVPISCDDGQFCNGAESCFNGTCMDGEPPCNTVQECDEAEGYCFTPLEAIQSATWLVYAFSDWSGFTATAFGVADDLFATNAHVTEGIKHVFGEPNAQALLFQHETGEQRAIMEVWTHPGYDANPTGTPDVGLLLTEPSGSLPRSFEPLLLARYGTLLDLRVFDEVSLCGFPGNLSSIDLDNILEGTGRPRASCLQGTISALRPFDPTDPATPENTVLIQYDLPIVGGTSGSAVFDSQGNIIGVNSFFFPGGGDSSFAIRSDKVRELMLWAESGELASTVLEALNFPPCQTSYFNPEWQFGFDLPAGFNQIPDDESSFEVMFNTTSGGVWGVIGIDVTAGSLEAAYLGLLQFLEEDASREMVTTNPIVMSNGVPGFFTVFLSQNEDSSNPQDDFYFYIVQTVGVFGVYDFWGGTTVSDVPSLGPILADAALSLCTEWPRTPSRSPSSVPRYGQSEWDASHYRDMVRKAAENMQRSLPTADKNSEKD